jgi:membrane associated rhomboid family serine protease
MGEIGIIGLILIISNVVASYKGFKDYGFFYRYSFRVGEVTRDKEYKRLFTSGFLHVSWRHLIVNMIVLYLFSYRLEAVLGPMQFLVIYLASLVGGNLFAMFIHRNNPLYSAVGASGAISGLVFASIALFPGMQMGLLFIPIMLPSWVFGIGYMLYTLYGIKSQRDNIGHEAHLGGALIGMIVAIAMVPAVLVANTMPILLMFLPVLFFIYRVLTQPNYLPGTNFSGSEWEYRNADDKFNAQRRARELEMNRLLDKINRWGMDSLTEAEKEKLEELSEK